MLLGEDARRQRLQRVAFEHGHGGLQNDGPRVEKFIDEVDGAVESLVEDVPGGGVVNLVWDFVLLPGRAGVRVATTVLRRGDSGQ